MPRLIEQQVFRLRRQSRLRAECAGHHGARRSLFRKRRLLRRQRDFIERTISENRDRPGLEPLQRHGPSATSRGQMIRVTAAWTDALDAWPPPLDLLNSTVSNRTKRNNGNV